jgi:hypothetical protein
MRDLAAELGISDVGAARHRHRASQTTPASTTDFFNTIDPKRTFPGSSIFPIPGNREAPLVSEGAELLRRLRIAISKGWMCLWLT